MLSKTSRLPGKTLVIGAKGFIGRAFFEAYRSIYPDTIGTHYEDSLSYSQFNLLNSNIADLKIRKGEYEYALIAAGNTNLTACELNKNLTFEANVTGILKLVSSLIQLEIQPILFSTAYVFDGVSGNYSESSKTNPINEYGRQKELVDNELKNICGDNYLLIRISKIFDLMAGGNTLIDEICFKLFQGEQIYAAYDQIFSPLHIDDLVNSVISLQVARKTGLYNVCGQEVWSRFDLAVEICKKLSLSPDRVTPISLEQIERAFPMPKQTTLNLEKLNHTIPNKTIPTSSYLNRLQTLYSNYHIDFKPKK